VVEWKVMDIEVLRRRQRQAMRAVDMFHARRPPATLCYASARAICRSPVGGAVAVPAGDSSEDAAFALLPPPCLRVRPGTAAPRARLRASQPPMSAF